MEEGKKGAKRKKEVEECEKKERKTGGKKGWKKARRDKVGKSGNRGKREEEGGERGKRVEKGWKNSEKRWKTILSLISFKRESDCGAWCVGSGRTPDPEDGVTLLHMQWWRLKRSEEQNNPSLLLLYRKLQPHHSRKRLKTCCLSEKPVTLQQTGRARDCWDNHSTREDSLVVALFKTREPVESAWRTCVGHGGSDVGPTCPCRGKARAPETWWSMACEPCQRACRGRRTRRTPCVASSRRTVYWRASTSWNHTFTVLAVVCMVRHGEKVLQNLICSDQWRAWRFLILRWISATCSKTRNEDMSLVIRHASPESVVCSNLDEVWWKCVSHSDVCSIRQMDGVCESSPEGRSRTCVEIVGGQDHSESKCRCNSSQGRVSSKVQQPKHWRSCASTRCSGKSDLMLASRVGNASLVGSDTSHGCAAVDGETRWMVVWKVPRETQQEDSVWRLFWEPVSRWGDEVCGGSTVPSCRVTKWKDAWWSQTGSCRREIRPWILVWEDHEIRWTSPRDRHGSEHHEDSETSSTDFRGSDLLDVRQAHRARQLVKLPLSRHLQWPRKVKGRVKMQASDAVRRCKIWILQQSFISSEFLAQQTPRTNRTHRHPDQWRPKMGALMTTQPATTVLKLQLQLQAVRWNRQIGGEDNSPWAQVLSVTRKQQNFQMRMKKASSNKLKDWRQFMQKRSRASVRWKMTSWLMRTQKESTRKLSRSLWQARRRSSTRWTHSESLMCAKYYRGDHNEMGKRSQERQVEMQIRSQRFQTWLSRNGRTVHFGKHSSNGNAGRHACGSARMFNLVPRCRKRVLPCWGKRGWPLLASEKLGEEVPRQRSTSGAPRGNWRQLESCKKFNEFVVTATDCIGTEQCREQPSRLRRPRTAVIFECYQDDFFMSGSNVEVTWVQENLGARLKLNEACWPKGSRVTEKLPPCDENKDWRGHHSHCITWDLHQERSGHLGSQRQQVQTNADPDSANASEEWGRWTKTGWRISTSLPQMSCHFQTSLEVSTKHILRSPRGQQDARIARRCRLPKIATTWQVYVGNAETWNHDTKE